MFLCVTPLTRLNAEISLWELKPREVTRTRVRPDLNWIILVGSWLVTRLTLVRQLRVGADCELRNMVQSWHKQSVWNSNYCKWQLLHKMFLPLRGQVFRGDRDRWRALVKLRIPKMTGISWLAENRTPPLSIYITIKIISLAIPTGWHNSAYVRFHNKPIYAWIY